MIAMGKAKPRLPVNIVFDIDHTLVSYVPAKFLGGIALPPGKWCPAPLSLPASHEACALLAPAEATACMQTEGYERVWCTTLQYEGPNATHQQHAIALRPHVVPFFRHVLVDRALDTDHVCVDVSLWTRRPKSYAQTVAAEVLERLVMCEQSGADVIRAPLVHDARGGEMCCNKEEGTDGVAWERADLTFFAGNHSGWKKSIRTHSSPFTTLLIDDKCENFIPWECRTGHCVHVPSFRPWDAESAALDHLFFSPKMEKATEDDDLFVEQCLLSGGDTVSLLQLVKSFVDTCHHHATTLHSLSIPAATPSASLCTDASTSDFLQQFNFFECSDTYKDLWERFHHQHETSDSLVSFFSC